MSDKSHIEWTDATWNPITGCSILSPGCTNCYAMQLAGTRLRHHPSRAGLTREVNGNHVWTGDVRLNEQWLTQPLQWSRPRMIFVCAHGDLFHESVPDEWIDRVFAVMALAPQHTFQVLTKRSARMREYVSEVRATWAKSAVSSPGSERIRLQMCALNGVDEDDYQTGLVEWPLHNVWLGVSCEDQPRHDERREDLENTPAAVRFLSAGPMLSGIDLDLGPHDCKRCNASGSVEAWGGEPGGQQCPECKGTGATYRKIDWIIVGGESGRNARPMHPDWARSIRDQCVSAGVAFFFKQWGEWRPSSDDELPARFSDPACDDLRCMCSSGFVGDMSIGSAFLHKPSRWPQCFPNGENSDASCASEYMRRAGKKRAGRLLDGREWNEMPGTSSAEATA